MECVWVRSRSSGGGCSCSACYSRPSSAYPALIRKQWVENERFTFPLVRLPILLAESPEPGQKFNGLRPVVAALARRGPDDGCCILTKGMHLFYPIRSRTLRRPSTRQTIFTERPWNGLNDMPNFAVYPLVIGISYLMSSEVCVSLWLFYLVFKLQTMFGSLYAWDMSWDRDGLVRWGRPLCPMRRPAAR